MKQIINITVNHRHYEVAVEPRRTLAELIRYDLGLTGTKIGCALGDCGACNVLINGETAFSCLVLAVEADGSEIITIEGLAENGKLHPLQQAFVDLGAIQCGFCTPGMVLTSLDLLMKNLEPTEDEVRRALSGNLCRCTGYQKIVEAVIEGGKRMKELEAAVA
jgi:carbon-monoxide dehydrogenase small subunit